MRRGIYHKKLIEYFKKEDFKSGFILTYDFLKNEYMIKDSFIYDKRIQKEYNCELFNANFTLDNKKTIKTTICISHKDLKPKNIEIKIN